MHRRVELPTRAMFCWHNLTQCWHLGDKWPLARHGALLALWVKSSTYVCMSLPFLLNISNRKKLSFLSIRFLHLHKIVKHFSGYSLITVCVFFSEQNSSQTIRRHQYICIFLQMVAYHTSSNNVDICDLGSKVKFTDLKSISILWK